MKKLRLLLFLLTVLSITSCKKSSHHDFNSSINPNDIVDDTIVTTSQYNNSPQNLEYFPVEPKHKRHRDDYDPEDYICPECGDEKEEDEELCYYCNEVLEQKNKNKDEDRGDENEDEDE
jgi:hypothetical protein